MNLLVVINNPPVKEKVEVPPLAVLVFAETSGMQMLAEDTIVMLKIFQNEKSN